jgi:hypothetical protein
VQCIAYKERKGTILWLINLTAEAQTVHLSGQCEGEKFIGVLDESTFNQATTDPRGFQKQWKALNESTVELNAYAMAFLSINDA